MTFGDRRAPLGRGKGLDRGAGLERGGRLAHRSPRKADRYAAIAEACRAALERDRYRCRGLGLIPGHRDCWGPIDPQHVIPKGVRGDLADEPRNIVALCRGAHEWVGAEPDAARALGLHGRDGDPLTPLTAPQP